MGWRIAVPRDMPHIISFITYCEYKHVSIFDYIRISGKLVLPPRKKAIIIVYIRVGTTEISAMIYVNNTGLCLPIIHGNAEQLRDKTWIYLLHTYAKSLSALLATQKNFSIVQSYITKPIQFKIQYILLYCDYEHVKPPIKPLNAEVKIRQATKHDVNCLYDLYHHYKIEEVLLTGMNLHTRFVENRIIRDIENYPVFVAERYGQLIAKASSNAIGITYQQIGGVYTHEQWRCQGISTHVVYALMKHIGNQQQNICLFVKTENINAQALYQRLGFIQYDELCIGYW